MSESKGWQAISDGRLNEAADTFVDLMTTDRAAALRGLIRVRLLQNQGVDAADLCQSLMKIEPSSMSMALYGESVGSMGKRKEAEDWLTRALQADPKNGWIRALLGEQRVRRGKWDAGAQDLIDALSLQNRDEAFGHIAVVFSELSEAVAAGKVKSDDALKLLNRVDNTAGAKTQEMTVFFAAARRAYNSQTAVRNNELPPRKYPGAVSQPAPPAVPTRRERAPEHDEPKNSTHQGMVSRPKVIVGHEHHMTEMQSTMLGAPPLAALMTEDRAANEALQQLVANVGLPTWPSKLKHLDPIAAVRPQLLNYSPEILKRSELQMTKGSVAAQILVSRGVELLSSAVAGGAARPPEINLNGLAHVEMRCLDGVLDRLSDIADTYNLEEATLDKASLALGSFIGTVATRLTPAVWEFQREAMDSVVVLGEHKMHPFRAATEWLSAHDKDDAYLDYPVRRLLAAAKMSTELEPVADTTADLKDTPLRLRLAEIWMNYLPRAALASQVDIADDISVVIDEGPVVVYGMHPRWVPPTALGPRGIALLREDRAPLAYVRSTGEFLLLGTRQHFSRFLKYVVPNLTSESASTCLQYFMTLHRPHTQIVSKGEHAPRLAEGKNGQQVLLFWMQRGGVTTGYQLVFDPRGLLRWRLEFQKP